MKVAATDRAVIDTRHHGAARERSGGRVPEWMLGELPVVIAMDDRRPDVLSPVGRSLQHGALRNPDQTLRVAQTHLRCVDRSGVPDVTRVISGGLRRVIVDTVSRGVRPLDEPVLLPGHQEAVTVPVVQRKHVASDQAASVRVGRAAGTAEPRVAAVGDEATRSTRAVQRRALHDRSGRAPQVDTRAAHVRGDEVADHGPRGVVVRAIDHPRRHEQRHGVAQGHASQDPVVSSPASGWVDGVRDAVNLEAVRLVLADAVLDDAVRRPVERECLVPIRTIVDLAAAAELPVPHRVRIAPPDRHEPRAPDAERVAVEEVGLALLEQHVRAVLDGEDVRVLPPIVVRAEQPSQRDVIDPGETHRVATGLRRVGVPARRPESLDAPPAAPFHGEPWSVAIRLEEGPSFVLRAHDDGLIRRPVSCVPVGAAVHAGQAGRLTRVGAIEEDDRVPGMQRLRGVQDLLEVLPGAIGRRARIRVGSRGREIVGGALADRRCVAGPSCTRAAERGDRQREREHGADAEHDLGHRGARRRTGRPGRRRTLRDPPGRLSTPLTQSWSSRRPRPGQRRFPCRD
jgi:hypothetical protein